MNLGSSLDNKQLRSQGARLAAISMWIGFALFFLIDFLPSLSPDELSTFNIVSMIFFAVFASLFALPFSLIGGYALAWFLQKVQWYHHSKSRVVISGVLIASVALLVIFIAGGFLVSCLISHGKCGEDYAFLMQGIMRDPTFMKALFIAAVCGGITAWRLSRIAQQKPT